MTTIALSRLVHRLPDALHRLGESLAAMFEGLQEARTMAQRFKTLSQMTDGQLAARGLTRSQIPQAVLNQRVRT